MDAQATDTTATDATPLAGLTGQVTNAEASARLYDHSPGSRQSPIVPSLAWPFSRFRAIVRRWISSVPS
jgi:hypothetical protein